MKLSVALDIGEGCALSNVGECIYNIDLRAGQIFEYSKIPEELKELYGEYKVYKDKGLMDQDTTIEDALVILKNSDC